VADVMESVALNCRLWQRKLLESHRLRETGWDGSGELLIIMYSYLGRCRLMHKTQNNILLLTLLLFSILSPSHSLASPYRCPK